MRALQMVNGQLDFISDTFEQLKPGLSSYDSDADSAAKSLDPLLKTAVETVPEELQVPCDKTGPHATAEQRKSPSHTGINITRRLERPLRLGRQRGSGSWTAASQRTSWQP